MGPAPRHRPPLRRALAADGSYTDISEDPVTPRVKFGAPPDYEERDAKQRRYAEDFKLGLISECEYVVGVGHHPTMAAAKKAGLSDVPAAVAKRSATNPPPPPPEP